MHCTLQCTHLVSVLSQNISAPINIAAFKCDVALFIFGSNVVKYESFISSSILNTRDVVLVMDVLISRLYDSSLSQTLKRRGSGVDTQGAYAPLSEKCIIF